MAYNKKTKCDFCQYCAHGHCNAPRSDSFYCRDAANEFYAWLAEQKRKAQSNKRR